MLMENLKASCMQLKNRISRMCTVRETVYMYVSCGVFTTYNNKNIISHNNKNILNVLVSQYFNKVSVFSISIYPLKNYINFSSRVSICLSCSVDRAQSIYFCRFGDKDIESAKHFFVGVCTMRVVMQ